MRTLVREIEETFLCLVSVCMCTLMLFALARADHIVEMVLGLHPL